jgi:hypothetical protein
VKQNRTRLPGYGVDPVQLYQVRPSYPAAVRRTQTNREKPASRARQFFTMCLRSFDVGGVEWVYPARGGEVTVAACSTSTCS